MSFLFLKGDFMREPVFDLEKIKEKIMQLKGKDVDLAVNHGRKKISKYHGVIENTYNSVFVVRVNNLKKEEKMSCSYSDVLCGDVEIAVKE